MFKLRFLESVTKRIQQRACIQNSKNVSAVRGRRLRFESLEDRSMLASFAITQITDSPHNSCVGVFECVTANHDGSLLAFSSEADLTGENADLNQEIFLHDASSDTTTQITDTSGTTNVSPAISADGSKIAFLSFADLTGGNADGNLELFVFDVGSSSFTQITATTGGNVNGLALGISDDGNRIAFSANSDPTGGNAEGNDELFLYDALTATITQITSLGVSGNSLVGDISGDGSRIVFSSNGDLTGGNADEGFEAFLFDVASNTITQITDVSGGAAGSSSTLAINQAGTRVAFGSSADLTGSNSDSNLELFTFDVSTSQLLQITDTTTSFFSAGFAVNISDAGSRIVFNSNADLAGDNSENFIEVFMYDSADDSFTQISDSSGAFAGAGIFGIDISGDGTAIAFDSAADQTGGGSDGTFEVFLAKEEIIVLPAEIDVKPGNSKNKVNAKSQGVIPVAIYTTSDFDATTVNGASVTLEGVAADQFALEDVDGDGDLDMILHFDTQDLLDALDLELDSGESELIAVELSGDTLDDLVFQGFDMIEFFMPGKGKGK